MNQSEFQFNRPVHKSDLRDVSKVVGDLFSTSPRPSVMPYLMHTHDIRGKEYDRSSLIKSIESSGYQYDSHALDVMKFKNKDTGKSIYVQHQKANDRAGFISIHAKIPSHVASIMI